jgi:hypothetical protein
MMAIASLSAWRLGYTGAMCGRFSLRTPMTVLAQQFLVDLGPLAGLL